MENHIIIPYQFAYFWGSLYLLAIWLFFYWRLPGIRRIFLFFSLSIVWLGLIAEYFWFLRDWWHPITITRTTLGIEDFIASMTHLTIPALLYKYVFSKKVLKVTLDKFNIINFFSRFSYLLFPLIGLFILLHYCSGIHIAYAFTICMLVSTFFMLCRRPDLVVAAFWSGLLFDLVFLVLYTFGNILSPGVFESLWDKSVLSGIRFFNVPVIDYMFYFFWGASGGIVYEYVFSLRIEKSSGSGLAKDLGILKKYLLSNIIFQK